MLFLNPNDFEGCESKTRITISGVNFSYALNKGNLELVFGIDGEPANYWKFDSLHNLIKARNKLDKMCEKQAGVLQQIASNLDNIESSL